MGNKFVETIKKKWLRSIALTILLFAIIIAIYLVINILVQKANFTDFDFTKEKIYSISQETKDKLGNLDKDVTIYIYNMYQYVEEFAYKYANLNEHIKVENLENLNSKTSWKTNYGVTDTSVFLIIQADQREKILYDSDLYTYDYTTYEEIDLTEEAITNAILDVITEVKPKICFLTGHNQYSEEYFQYLQISLEAEVNEVEYIDLLKTGSVPEDCEVLVITSLAEDITQKEADAILDYIKKGGEILLLTDPNLGKISMPNFQKVLDEYGVSISEGYLIEGDANQMMAGAPNFIIAPINTNSEIVKNVNMGLNVCLINSGKLDFASSEELEEKKVTLETLATVSDQAFYRTDLESNSESKIESDEDAAGATVGAMLTKEIDEENHSQLIVFANTVFATNVLIDPYYNIYAISNYNNEDVLLNSISYLTQREDNITIRKNGETVTTYNVTEMQTRIVLGVIFAIPVLIITIGIVVWQARRRKK